jgi:hypothetical protein
MPSTGGGQAHELGAQWVSKLFRLSRAMPKLNYDAIASNVREAREELEQIEKSLTADKPPSEDYLQVWFDHAFFHLNFAWNARHAKPRAYSGLTTEDYNRWAKFPRDININKNAVQRPKRRSPKRASGRRQPPSR